MPDPQTVQFDAPVGPPPTVSFDDAAKPAGSPASRFGQSFASGAGVTSDEDAKNFFRHPIDTAGRMLKAQGDVGNLGFDELGHGKYAQGAHDLIYSAIPVLGPTMSRSAHQLEEGDIAGGVGTSLGLGTSLAAGAGTDNLTPEVPTTPTAGSLRPTAFSKMRSAKDASTGVSSGLPPHPGAYEADPLGQLPVPEARPAAATGEALGGLAAPEPAQPLPPLNIKRPGEVAPEMTRPRAFFGGVRAEPIPPRSGLSLPPGPGEATATPSVPAPGEDALPRLNLSQKAVGEALDRSLDASPLKPGVSLRNQVVRAEPVSQSKAESSVIREHHYDPDAREFHVTTKSNPSVTYIYGDVDPDQAALMDNASSKGKAWGEFKKGGSPLVAKVVNGQRIPVRPIISPEDMNPETSNVRVMRPSVPAPDEDLTPRLRASVRQAKANTKSIQ